MHKIITTSIGFLFITSCSSYSQETEFSTTETPQITTASIQEILTGNNLSDLSDSDTAHEKSSEEQLDDITIPTSTSQETNDVKHLKIKVSTLASELDEVRISLAVMKDNHERTLEENKTLKAQLANERTKAASQSTRVTQQNVAIIVLAAAHFLRFLM